MGKNCLSLMLKADNPFWDLKVFHLIVFFLTLSKRSFFIKVVIPLTPKYGSISKSSIPRQIDLNTFFKTTLAFTPFTMSNIEEITSYLAGISKRKSINSGIR